MGAPTKSEEITRLVLDLGRSLSSHFDAQMTKLNLTLPQAMLLRQLGEPLPMNEAAGKLHCDPSNVTGIVDRLEARGLIARRQLSTDRRFKNLVLTAKGRRLKRRVDATLSSAPGSSVLDAAAQVALS